MDTIGSSSYQKPKNITYTLNRYVRDMLDFVEDGRKKGFILHKSDIQNKQLQLGIPLKTNNAQMQAIYKSMEYAKIHGVEIVITKIK